MNEQFATDILWFPNCARALALQSYRWGASVRSSRCFRGRGYGRSGKRGWLYSLFKDNSAVTITATISKKGKGNMVTNLELLRAVGEVVYGEFWQSPMAEALRVNRRTINRWKQELWEVPDVLVDGRPLMSELQKILTKHERDLATVKKRIERER